MLVSGMLSCQHSKNVIDGKKRIILAPTPEQRSSFDTVTFAEGEVYGVDILVSSGEDGKAGHCYGFRLLGRAQNPFS